MATPAAEQKADVSAGGAAAATDATKATSGAATNAAQASPKVDMVNVCKLVNENWRDYPDLLGPVPDDPEANTHQPFFKAVGLAFCATSHLMFHVGNYDLLWRPDADMPEPRPNYYQWISHESTQRDPTETMMHYLFKGTDCHYGDKVGEDGGDLKEITAARMAFLDELRIAFSSPEEYLAYVATMLFMPVKSFTDQWLTMVTKAWTTRQTKLAAAKAAKKAEAKAAKAAAATSVPTTTAPTAAAAAAAMLE